MKNETKLTDHSVGSSKNKIQNVHRRKSIQIGTSDFKELIENNNYFVDKSLLIKEFIENGAKIILTPRPRRFGKTLNLSMLRYFFDIRTKEETKNLFLGLNIENEKDIMKLQGEYPVIFITFKNEKYISYEDFKDGITFLVKWIVVFLKRQWSYGNWMGTIKW